MKLLLTCAAFIFPATSFAASTIDMGVPPLLHEAREFDFAQVVDLNDDGREDFILSIPSGAEGFIVRLNAGQGTLGADLVHSFVPPAGRRAHVAALLHLNADALPDVVMSLTQLSGGCILGGISIMLNQGNGDFSAPQSFLFPQSDEVILGHDVNGNGTNDLIVSSRDDCSSSSSVGELLVFLNDGTGVFGSPTSYLPSGADPDHIAIGKFNADALPDIAISGTGSYLPNLGSGVFGPPVGFSSVESPRWIGAADLDGVLGDDMVMFDIAADDFHVFLNDGSGGFTESTQTVVDRNPWMLDFDSDGGTDVLFENGTLMRNTGGTLTPETLGLQGTIVPLLAADYDGDMVRDFVTLTGDFFQVQRSLGGTSFDAKPLYHGEVGAVMDYDEDGDPDLLWFLRGFATGFRFYENQGDGTFVGVQASMLNSDPLGGGELDAVAGVDVVLKGTSAAQAFGIVSGTMTGTFGSVQWYGWSDGLPHAIPFRYKAVAEDLNQDNLPDLVFARASGSNGAVTVQWNRSGTFPDATNLGTGTTPTRVVVGDFKKDGRPDLVANGWASFVMFFENQGSESFADPSFVEASTPTFLAAGDIDNDGSLDLVTRVNGGVNWHRGDGNGGFASIAQLVSMASGDFLEVVDVNRDSIPDIIAMESTVISDALVWINQGAGTFDPATRYPTVPGPTSLIMHDLNNDGAPEMIVGGTLVLRNRGDGVFEPCLTYPLGGAQFAADFTGDGKPDVVQRDALFINRSDDATAILVSDPTVTFVDAGVFLTWYVDAGSGGVDAVDVERAESPLGPFVSRARILPRRSGNIEFLDTNVVVGHHYWYRMVLVSNGERRVGSGLVHVQFDGLGANQLHAYPGLDGTSVEVRYRVGVPSSVRLALYDVRGRLVRTLVSRQDVRMGTYTALWHGRDSRGTRVAAGIYLVKLELGDRQFTRQIPYIQRP